jgi:hypothetical protein
MIDPIIDRSPYQKRLHMQKIRSELAGMGYSIVETEWLNAVLIANLSRERGRPRFKQLECSEQAAG